MIIKCEPCGIRAATHRATVQAGGDFENLALCDHCHTPVDDSDAVDLVVVFEDDNGVEVGEFVKNFTGLLGAQNHFASEFVGDRGVVEVFVTEAGNNIRVAEFNRNGEWEVF